MFTVKESHMLAHEAHTVVRALLEAVKASIDHEEWTQALEQLKIATELTYTYEAHQDEGGKL